MGRLGSSWDSKRVLLLNISQSNVSSLPLARKFKLDKSFATGRIPLRIKNFLQDNPTATLGDIKLALDLEVSTTTIGRYLQKIGYEQQVAKRKIVISEQNRVKRLEFCREMVGKDGGSLSQSGSPTKQWLKVAQMERWCFLGLQKVLNGLYRQMKEPQNR